MFFFFNVGNLIIWSYKYFRHDFAVSIIYYFIVKKKILFIATEESHVGALYTCIKLYVTSNRVVIVVFCCIILVHFLFLFFSLMHTFPSEMANFA